MNNVAKRKKSPGAIFRERSEPEGRVSGMIRANSVKTCVRRSRTQHAAKPRYRFHSTIIFTTYSILPIYRACRDARRRVETGVSPTPKGGCGGHPPHIRAYTRNRFFAYQPQATRRREPPPMPFAHGRLPIRRHALLRYGARSLTYLMYCSLPRALPDNEYPALTTVFSAVGG